MAYSIKEAAEITRNSNLSGRINPKWADAHTVDPNNLPAFMKPQPEPKSIGQAVAEAITTAVGNPFEAREEEATSQAREQYQNYQNEEIAQPVGVGNMLASAGSAISEAVQNPGRIPGMIMQTAETAAAERAADSTAEYHRTMDDIQNPVAQDYGYYVNAIQNLTDRAFPMASDARRTLAFTADWVRSTEIYNNFNFQWDTPEKNRMSEELARAYGKDSGIFFGDRDAYIKGAQILAQFKIDSRVGYDVDRNDPEAFKAYLAEYYPSLASASQDDFESLIKNAEDVKAVQEIMKVPGLVFETFANSSERADIYGKAYLEGRTLTEDEIARADQLTKRLEELNKMTPQTTLHPLMGILSQTGIQVAGMGSDAAVGAVAAGILGGGAYMMGAPAPIAKKIGSYAFKFGTMAGMYRRQVGEKYIEYLSYQNEDGTRTLTPREAKIAATIETGIETGIEFWNYDAIMSTLSGADRKAIQDIVARNKGNAEAIKGGLKGYLATAVKSWAPRAKEEILEEAYQSATGDIVHNAIVATHPQTTEKMVSVPEIAANSMDAMADAVPSVGGMIIGGDILSNIKGVRSLASIARLHNTMTEEAVDNAFTGQVLRDIQENQKENKLFKENPKAYMQVIKTEMDKAGLPNVYVDVEMLMNEKGGPELVQKLGQQSGYSPSEIQQVIESKGDLEVPTEVYCQTALPANDKIVDMTTSAPGINCTARQKDTIKRFQQNVKALAEQDEQEVQEIIPTIVKENFQHEDEQALAAEIISSSPNDVQNAYRKTLRDAEQEYKNVLREVWERDEEDSKDGLSGVRVVEDRHADSTGNMRVVQNRRQSRQKWWTDYFGIQTPTVEKKEQYAYDVLTGATRGGPRSLGVAHDLAADHGDTDEVTRIEAEFKANKERLDKMANTIATLRGMKDKIAKIQNVETTITRGMTPEAYRVYQRTTDLLSASPNKKVQQAARYDGVLFARMCQRLAEEWTRQGKKTTAEDVANTLQIVPSGGVADGGLKQSNWHGLVGTVHEVDGGEVYDFEPDPNKSYRFYHRHKGPMSDWGSAMFADNPEGLEHYGKQAWSVNHEDLTDIDDLMPEIKKQLQEDYDSGKIYSYFEDGEIPEENDELDVDAMASLYNPQDIVMSAEAYDNNHYYQWLWDRVCDRLDVKGIKTRDGAFVFDEDIIHPENELTLFRAQIGDDVTLYNQTAWHGSPYDFEHFDLGAMGSGEGRQVHGWGLYFAKDRKISEGYKDFLKNLRSTVVIDGKKFVGYKNGFRDEEGNRPSDKKLRFALLNLSLEGSREKAIQRVSELARTSKGTGFEEDYAGALKILKDSQTASVERPEAKLYEVDIPDNDVLLDEDKFLKDQPKAVQKAIADYYRSRPDFYFAPEDDSIKDSTTTGEGFYKDVVFQMKREGSTNPKRDASLLLNSLGIKGVTYEGNKDGRCFVVFDDKAISIIDKYNQQQAQIQGQTTVTGDVISLFDAADQSTFMHESAHWYLINMQKLALNENASRQFTEDFFTLQQWFGNKKIDADISVEQHEKFARGFEAYLRTGKAPAPQLHGIFNRFKSWLTSIYRDFKQLGGKPTKEVTAVMDRMLATEDEISMAMKEQMVDDFKRAGGMKLMLDENARTWERWYQKVKEEAEAKVLEKAMKDLEAADQKDIAEAIEAKRNEIAEEMGKDQFWRADEMVRMNGGDLDVLADFGFTPEEYRAELEKRGGSFEAALEAQLKGFKAEMQESRIDQNELYEDAKKAVQDSEYQEMLHALEYEALAAKARAYIAGEDEATAKKQAKADKATAKANKEAAEAAEKARKISEKLEVQEDLRNEKVKEAQSEMKNMKAGIRIVRVQWAGCLPPA